MGTRNSGIGFDWTAAGRCCATANGLFGRPAQFAHSSNWTLMRMPCLKLTIVRGCCIDQQAVASINFNRRHHPPTTMFTAIEWMAWWRSVSQRGLSFCSSSSSSSVYLGGVTLFIRHILPYQSPAFAPLYKYQILWDFICQTCKMKLTSKI